VHACFHRKPNEDSGIEWAQPAKLDTSDAEIAIDECS